eukprot:TRINITY_DN2305_c0_g2_i1.p1 TRINITY_DN2305_c0_g2~~TRINITY_DN2305_c0_g2_i1.p1  ORF type:complete len:122 (+),score=8.79 TRINITY_DN2305_c0_g2_i1:141-506(+)
MNGDYRNTEKLVELQVSQPGPFPVRYSKVTAWFADYLPPEYRGVFLPNWAAYTRNYAIGAIFVQFLSTIAGFATFFLRRNRFYLIVNSISLAVLTIGLYGVVKFKKYPTAIHGMVSNLDQD